MFVVDVLSLYERDSLWKEFYRSESRDVKQGAEFLAIVHHSLARGKMMTERVVAESRTTGTSRARIALPWRRTLPTEKTVTSDEK